MKLNSGLIIKVLYFVIFFNLLFGIFEMFKLPSEIKFINDFLCIIIFIWEIKNFKNILKDNYHKRTIHIIVIMFFIYLFTSILNLVKPQLFIWAFRNVFRFLIIYIASSKLLTIDDYNKILSKFYKIYFFNILVLLYQYFILGLSQDYLGGIFGIGQGCNAGLNIYFCVILIYTTIQYINKKKNIFSFLFIIFSSLVFASFAELKVYYLEFVFIELIICLFYFYKFKVFLIFIISVVGLLVGLEVMKFVFPQHYDVLINLANFKDYANMQSGGYNISRFGAFKEINLLFFKDNLFYNLFGFGFGNCEYSSLALFKSDFYNLYGSYHYMWFTHQMLFLQVGIIGFFGYLYVHIRNIIDIFKIDNNYLDKKNKVFLITLTLIIILNIFYNSFSIVDYSYFIYPLLAICLTKNDSKKIIKKI